MGFAVPSRVEVGSTAALWVHRAMRGSQAEVKGHWTRAVNLSLINESPGAHVALRLSCVEIFAV